MAAPIPFRQMPSVFRNIRIGVKSETFKGLQQAADRAKIIMTSATRTAPAHHGNNGVYNYGTYLRGWRSVRSMLNGSWGVLVYNTKVYGYNIDYGRRPGARRPPVAAITRWAMKRFGLPYKDARKRAFGIATAIAKRGIGPVPVLRAPNTEQSLKDAMETAMEAAIVTAVKKAVP